MNKEQYLEHAARYGFGNAPLYKVGHTFIVPDIPTHAETPMGMYGRPRRVEVGQRVTITHVKNNTHKMNTYHSECVNWFFLECDVLLGSQPQLNLFQMEEI